MIMGAPTILVFSARDIEGCTSQASFNQNSDSSNVLKHTTRKDSLTVCGNFLIVSRKLHFVKLHSKGVASVGRCFFHSPPFKPSLRSPSLIALGRHASLPCLSAATSIHSRKIRLHPGLKTELLSIALALSMFGDLPAERSVRIFSDNRGSEHATRRGSAKEFDHTCIVHSIWKRAAKLKAQLWIGRVPTKPNIADLPSREEYDLLRSLCARWVPPHLDKAFRNPSAWRALSILDISLG